MDTALIAAKIAELLIAAFNEGSGGYGFETALQDAITKNITQFGVFKSKAMVKDLKLALFDAEGNLLSFDEFRKEAGDILKLYNKTWLSTEYDMAIKSGQSAVEWAEIQAAKDSLPLLKYDAVLDTRTTKLCRKFEGLVLPVDNPFWLRYYPPNHWRCRSKVQQLQADAARITPRRKVNDMIKAAAIPKEFRNNVGVSGRVFPINHPYGK